MVALPSLSHNYVLFFLLIAFVGSCYCSDFFSFGGGPNFGSYSHGGGTTRSPFGSRQDDSYYNALGVPRDASEQEIKRAYRQLAMKTHPDKGGNAEEFKKITEAYEVLTDTEKRGLYDRFGKAGVQKGGMKSGMGGMGGMGGIFGQGFPGFGGGSGAFDDLFRGFGGFNVPLIFQLDLTLEDLFKGKELIIPIHSSKIKIVIEPGMYGGQELILRGKVHDARQQPRDLIFRLREVEHASFERKNADLLKDVTISLKEALMGFERTFKHLDGSSVKFRSKQGMVTSPNQVFMLEGLGMPIYRQHQEDSRYHQRGKWGGGGKDRGRLFIRVKIEFPKRMWLQGEDLEAFEKLLSGKKVIFPTKSSTSSTSASATTPLESTVTAGTAASSSVESTAAATSTNSTKSSTTSSASSIFASKSVKTSSTSKTFTSFPQQTSPSQAKESMNPGATPTSTSAATTPTTGRRQEDRKDPTFLTLDPSDISQFGLCGKVDDDEDDDEGTPFRHFFFR